MRQWKTNPFTENDFTSAIVETVANTTLNASETTNLEIRSDLVKTLGQLNVPTRVLEKVGVQVALNNVVEKISNDSSTAKVTHREYRIKDSVLKKMESHTNQGDHFYDCLMEVKNGEWRLYQAISAIDVKEIVSSLYSNSDVERDLLVALRDEGANVDSAKFYAGVSKVKTTTANIVAGPYFLVVGASYWHSPRYHKSSAWRVSRLNQLK